MMKYFAWGRLTVAAILAALLTGCVVVPYDGYRGSYGHHGHHHGGYRGR